MPTITANSHGVATGKFTIPANVNAGSKLVQFTGAGGSHGEAAFVGQGYLETRTMQQVSTTTTVYRDTRVDPLAQTFSLDSQMQAGGVDLYITAKGATPIQIQIRETQVGFPTGVVLAEAQLAPADITVNAWNRFVFAAPPLLLGQTEYAIVVLCNDATGAVAIAELGKYDVNTSTWVTTQPFQIGVLLSSSNASTWTAHQDKDLAFRLLATTYTESEHVVNLGSVTVTGATDLIVLAPLVLPATGADGSLSIGLPDGSSVTTSDRQVVRLPSATTGTVTVSAKVKSSNGISGTLLPGTQIISGVVATTADYVTRAIDADVTGCTVNIIFDAIIPSGAGVAVYLSGVDVGDTYSTVTQFGTAKPLGDGKYEFVYRKASVTEAKVRVKLVLTGTATARPIVSNLRVSVI